MVYYSLGRKADSHAPLAAMLQNDAELNAMGIAEMYAFRDQSDEAMNRLDRAFLSVPQEDELAWMICRQTQCTEELRKWAPASCITAYQ